MKMLHGLVLTLIAAILAGTLYAQKNFAEANRGKPDKDCTEAVCGLNSAEDLLWLPGTGKIIASTYGDPATEVKLYLIDPQTQTLDNLYPAEAARVEHDRQRFPQCPGAPDPQNFYTHGLSLEPIGGDRYRLYVVGHGARESVEVFHVDTGTETPAATWVGCVVVPSDDFINSVTSDGDGGFYVTRMMARDSDFETAISSDESGFLYHWHPKTGLRRVPGTAMSLPNGVIASADGESVYVAGWGRGQIVRFTPAKDWQHRAASLPFHPDNLRRSHDGQILVAGQVIAERQDCGEEACFSAWGVAEVDPETLSVTPVAERAPTPGFAAATAAISSPEGYWVGTFAGDRILFIPAQSAAQ